VCIICTVCVHVGRCVYTYMCVYIFIENACVFCEYIHAHTLEKASVSER